MNGHMLATRHHAVGLLGRTHRTSWMLGIVGVARFLALVDDTAAAVALPEVGRDLGLGLH